MNPVMKIHIYRYESQAGKPGKARDVAVATSLEDAVDVLIGLSISHQGRGNLAFGMMHHGGAKDPQGLCGLGSVSCTRIPCRVTVLSDAKRYLALAKQRRSEIAARGEMKGATV